jgi:hypothetical protein
MGDGMEATAEDPDGDGDGDGEKKKKPEASRADSDGDGDDDDGDGDGDKGARSEPPPENRRAAAAPSHAGSLASIFGLREGASTPAIKSAAIAFVNLGRAVMSATETKSPSEAQGALRSILEDAAEVADLRASLAASKKREVRREKMDLLMKLAAKNLPGYPRGELLVDREVGGKRVVGPAPMFDEMPIATLRGFVNGKLKGQAATGPERTPFDPDPNRARTSTENALVEGDLATPFIQDIASRSSASPEQLAKTARALEAQGVR